MMPARRPGKMLAVRRHLLSFATAALLLLCAATIAFWIRGYWVSDEIEWSHSWQASHDYRTAQAGFEQAAGQLRIDFWYRSNKGVGPPSFDPVTDAGPPIAIKHRRDGHHAYMYIDGPAPKFEHFGFVADWDQWSSDAVVQHHGYRCLLVLPFWSVLSLSCLAACVMSFRLIRRRGEKRHRICSTCSYNLTGNLSGICPECGTPIADPRGGRVTTEKSPAK